MRLTFSAFHIELVLVLCLSGCTSCDRDDPCGETRSACTTFESVDGSCVEVFSRDGTVCPAPIGCDFGACQAGLCVGTLADPGVACMRPSTSGCVLVPDDSLACDDENVCTRIDRCRGGVCTGQPKVCEASECSVPMCDPVTGCFEVAVADGTPCGDEVACNGDDACFGGECTVRCRSLCFEDATGSLEEIRMMSIVAGGAALFDANGDDFLDLVLAGEPAVLQLHVGDGVGGFVDATIDSGLQLEIVPASPAHGGDARPQGVIAADFDRDGHEDLFVMMDGPNQLYLGASNGEFVRAAFPNDAFYTTGAVAADVDADGWLDLYVTNYIREIREPGTHVPEPNQFFRGGPTGFTAVDLGIAGTGTTLSALFTDYDDDGDPDLFVCNDFGDTIEPNQLYRNDAGTFEEVTSREGARLAFFCMGLSAGDYDRDGDRDVFATNLGPNALLRRLGDRYSDAAEIAEVAGRADACTGDEMSTSWASAFVDFDLDGWLDLYVANGFAGYGSSAFEDPHRLYRHLGPSLTFREVGASAGVASNEQGRGAVFGDLDRDGDVDIVQIHADGAPLVLRNITPRRGGSLRVELPGPNRIGTIVTVAIDGAQLVRELRRHEGYASGQPAELYFGLGMSDPVQVHVRLPDGRERDYVDVFSGDVIRVPTDAL